jgi:hypothetical protein
MVIAGYAQVARIADVSAKLDLMVAQDLCPVINKQELDFLLDKRAVAAIDAQTVPKIAKSTGLTESSCVLAVSSRTTYKVGRLTCTKVTLVDTRNGVEPRNADVVSRSCADPIGYDIDVVSDVSETKVGEYRLA